MARNDIKLGVLSSEILLSPFGRKLDEGMREVSRQERTASGRLVRDVVATKKVFTLTYSLIAHADLEAIATLYALQTELNLIITRPDFTENNYTVLLNPFDKSRATAVGEGLWAGVTIEMEEV